MGAGCTYGMYKNMDGILEVEGLRVWGSTMLLTEHQIEKHMENQLEPWGGTNIDTLRAGSYRDF